MAIKGTYRSPDGEIGDEVNCLRYGLSRIKCFGGPARWPMAQKITLTRILSKPTIVVNDSLVEALKSERPTDIAKWLGVCNATISAMRKKFLVVGFKNWRKNPEGSTSAELLFGPYNPPECNVGDFIVCLERGPVRVTAFTGAGNWPIAVRMEGAERPHLVITEELLRALRQESNLSFSRWLGIHRKTCQRLRTLF